MSTQITLNVCRRLDNRLENLPDDGPFARELHVHRKTALHDVLDGLNARQTGIQVQSWGDTDDSKPHEWVEIIIDAGQALLASAAFTHVVVPGLKAVGEKLAEKAVDEGTSEFVKWLISKLKLKQEEEQILDVNITIKAGTTATMISIVPPSGTQGVTISIS
jgi:hypothetical protein